MMPLSLSCLAGRATGPWDLPSVMMIRSWGTAPFLPPGNPLRRRFRARPVSVRPPLKTGGRQEEVSGGRLEESPEAMGSCGKARAVTLAKAQRGISTIQTKKRLTGRQLALGVSQPGLSTHHNGSKVSELSAY